MKFKEKHFRKYEVWKIENNYYIIKTSKKIFDLFFKIVCQYYFSIPSYGIRMKCIYMNDDVIKCRQFLLSNYGTTGILIDNIKRDKKGNIIIKNGDVIIEYNFKNLGGENNGEK